MQRGSNASSSNDPSPFGMPPDTGSSSNRQQSSNVPRPPTLTPQKERRLSHLMGCVYTTISDLIRFCTKEGIPLPTNQFGVQSVDSNLSSSDVHSQLEALHGAVAKLQVNDVRLTRRLYGYNSARGHAKHHGLDDRHMLPSEGELSVTITRKSPSNHLPPRIEMFIARNESTTISRLESYFLDWNLTWKALEVLRTGSPSKSVRKHISATFDCNIEGRTMVVVRIDSSKTGANRQIPRGCFCNPTFEFDDRPHSSIQCVLQLIASAIVFSAEGDPTDGKWIGRPVDLRFVPADYRSLEFERLEVERLADDQQRHVWRAVPSRRSRDHQESPTHGNTREQRR